MAKSPELLPLLYRADWTKWSMSADIVIRRRQSGGERSAAAGPGGGQGWIETRHRILLAPGGRYRIEPIRGNATADHASAHHASTHHASGDRLVQGEEPDEEHDRQVTLIVCDSQSYWVIRGDEAERYIADPQRTPIDDVVRPAWLISQFLLKITGQAELAGRTVHKVRGTPRLPVLQADRTAPPISSLDHVNLLVDPELGIVLRRESMSGGHPLEIIELQDFTVDQPADGDPALFRPAEGIVVEGDLGWMGTEVGTGLDLWGRGFHSTSISLGAGGIAVSLGVAAAGLAVRRLARDAPPRSTGVDDEAAMPRADDDEQYAVQAADRTASSGPEQPGPEQPGPEQQEPLSDELLNLIGRTGLPPLNLTLQAHRWVDVQAATRAYRSLAIGIDHSPLLAMNGFFGPDSIWSWLRSGHRSAQLRVAMPDRYLVDYWLDERRRQPLAVACDTERLRKAYHNRIVTSPAQPLPPEFVRLLDPAWLLSGWKLTAAGQTTVSGRAAFRVIAEPPGTGRRPEAVVRIIAMIDAELGILLRQVSFVDGQPAVRFELREVVCHRGTDAADFALQTAPGLPVIESDGGSLHELDLPTLVRTSGEAASAVIGGVQSAMGRLSAQARRIRGASGGRWP